jgi:diguanylate cyclase (GGDEF)-like protein
MVRSLARTAPFFETSSVSVELASGLLTARHLQDIRGLLSRLRREMGADAMALLPSSGEWPTLLDVRPSLSDAFRRRIEQGAADMHGGGEIPLERAHGRLVFAFPSEEERRRTIRELRRIAAMLDASLRNVLDFEALYSLAVTDPLTGLYNRRFFEEALQRELSSSHRHGRALAVLAVDVDNLKRINDSAGHAAGDEALVAIANALRSTSRQSDVVARVGGDEFLVLVVAADRMRAQTLANRFLRRIQSVLVPIAAMALSASVGIAAVPPCPVEPAELLARADRALYRAKDLGRCQVVLAASDDRPRRSCKAE